MPVGGLSHCPIDIWKEMPYTSEVLKGHLMSHENSSENVSRCVIDVIARKVYVYSDQGNERIVECESVDEFMNVLEYIRSQVNQNIVFYSNLL